MMGLGLDSAELGHAVAEVGQVVRVLIVRIKGSVPRGVGTSMLVWRGGQSGTIGGGALEFDAVKRALGLLEQGGEWRRETCKIVLGPELGQCCGGTVELFFERFSPTELAAIDRAAPSFTRPQADGISPAPAPWQAKRQMQARRIGADMPSVAQQDGWISEVFATTNTPLWLYGAGHVGRAIVRVLHGLPFAITWVDTDISRFPSHRCGAKIRVAKVPAAAVQDAPPDALHYVLTFSHAHDLEICHQVLLRPFGHLGLIGSASKKARFLKRLREMGHTPATLARLQSPIGDPNLGKSPAEIAIGLAHELIRSRTITASRKVSA